MTRIEILIAPNGQATVQTKGFSGPSCQAASRFIEQALGSRINEAITPEFHQQASQQQVVHDGG
jgi:hypothetical protein